MTNEQLSYLAGIVDGEGNIAIGKRKPKDCINFSYTGYVKICNTDARMIKWVIDTVGVGSIHSTTATNRRKPLHWWCVNDRQAETFLHEIYPFLVIKKEQAETYFRFRESFKKQFPRGTPPELLCERESCFIQMKTLHNI